MKQLIPLLYWLTFSISGYAQDGELDIPFEEFYLDNGLRVIVHEDRKAPIVAVTLWYHVGSRNENVGKTGFAHLFEHLMFNGSENYDGEYFAPFQEVGATSMNGTTNTDRTNYFQTVPTSALDLAMWMESDRMGHLLGAIDQEKLDEQRNDRVKTSLMEKSLTTLPRTFSRKGIHILGQLLAQWKTLTRPALKTCMNGFRPTMGRTTQR